MEEIKLFDELNFIKYEIEKDLNTLEKIENHLKLKIVYDNNKELSDRVFNLTNDYNNRINELKCHNTYLERDHSKINEILNDKDKEISRLKLGMKDIIDENKNLQISLSRLKGIY